MIARLPSLGLRTAMKASQVLHRGARAIEKYVARRDQVISSAGEPLLSRADLELWSQRLWWPVSFDLDFAVVVESEIDVVVLNAGIERLGTYTPKVICNDAGLRKRLRSQHVLISYEDIGRRKVPLVVIPGPGHEASTEIALRKVWRESRHNFNIYDQYNVSDVTNEGQTRRYRDVELMLYPTVLWPTLYSNWGFVNYLIDEVIKGQKLDVLDMFAGSGILGFCLKRETDIRSISFADANFWAIRSIRETAARQPDIAGPAWLTEGLRGIPSGSRFDLIVGNPPHVDQSLGDPSALPGSDPTWSAHQTFFEDGQMFLKPGGKVVFIEATQSTAFEQFYRTLEQRFPRYRVARHYQFPNYACYVIEIELI